MNKMYDFLFELTEDSDNEGAQILCEAASLESALTILCWQNGFKRKELRFIERMETWEGELLGLDTY